MLRGMKKFPGRYKFILKRDITTGEQYVFVEQVIRKKATNGLKLLEREYFDDLRSFSSGQNAVVTLEVADIETEKELLDMLKELKIIWNQQKGIRYGAKELHTSGD